MALFPTDPAIGRTEPDDRRTRIALVGPNPWQERAEDGGLGALFEGWAAELAKTNDVCLVAIDGTDAMSADEKQRGFFRVSVPDTASLRHLSSWADCVSLHQQPEWAIDPLKSSVLMHNLPVPATGTARSWPQGFGERPIFDFVDNIGGVSRWLANRLTNATGRHISVVHPFVHSDFVAARPITKEKSVAFVGRLLQRKGIEDLVSTAEAEMCSVPILVTDWAPPSVDTEEADRLRELVRQTKGMQLIEAPRKPSDIAELMKVVSAVVVPSRNEPFGMVSIEAQAAGTRVVLYDSGGLPSTAGRAARLVKPGDLRMFADAIEEAVDRPHVSNEQREAIAKKFSLESSTRALTHLISGAERLTQPKWLDLSGSVPSGRYRPPRSS